MVPHEQDEIRGDPVRGFEHPHVDIGATLHTRPSTFEGDPGGFAGRMQGACEGQGGGENASGGEGHAPCREQDEYLADGRDVSAFVDARELHERCFGRPRSHRSTSVGKERPIVTEANISFDSRPQSLQALDVPSEGETVVEDLPGVPVGVEELKNRFEGGRHLPRHIAHEDRAVEEGGRKNGFVTICVSKHEALLVERAGLF